MIGFSSSGDGIRSLEKRLKKKHEVRHILERFGPAGVSALRAATPREYGEAAASWSYRVTSHKDGSATIRWTNSSMAGSTPVVILLQYGHATGTGGYVRGQDFINPAIQPVLEQIKAAIRKEVTKR